MSLPDLPLVQYLLVYIEHLKSYVLYCHFALNRTPNEGWTQNCTAPCDNSQFHHSTGCWVFVNLI